MEKTDPADWNSQQQATDKKMAARISPLVRNLIREQYGAVDEKVPNIIKLLTDRGADECWHKVIDFLHGVMFDPHYFLLPAFNVQTTLDIRVENYVALASTSRSCEGESIPIPRRHVSRKLITPNFYTGWTMSFSLLE